jgi:hypothetical protein
MLTPNVAALAGFDRDQPGPDSTSPDGLTEVPSRWGLPECFAVAQVAGPAILFLPGSQAFRAPLRIGIFALSLSGLIWCFRHSRLTKTHPSWVILLLAAAYMTVMIFHPATNTGIAGMAQIGMHLAVAAPLFWAPSYFRGDYRRLLRVLTILWVLNGASTVVGILQVRDPATWMPKEFSSAIKIPRAMMAMYQYRAADGNIAVRPPGLGDSPGSASGAGMFVAVVGLAYLGLPVSPMRKLLGFVLGVAGIVVIFLSHIRSALVVLVGCAVVFSLTMIMQGRLKTVLALAVCVTACGICSLFYAEFYGGRSTMDRFSTLLADDPMKVYEKSYRLGMVVSAFDTTLVEHPLGAGLGRWGMMRKYFGNEDNLESPEIFAEVQFVAWALDGGVVLLSLYLIALAAAVHRLVRSSFWSHSWQLRQWGAVLIMLSAGPIAFLFSYCPFYSQMGIQFWLLIGAFEGLAQGEEQQSPPVDLGAARLVPSPRFAGEPGLALPHL